MKKTFAVLGMVLLAALLVLPGTAKSEMYIEAYMGGVSAPSDSQTFSGSWSGGSTGSYDGIPYYDGTNWLTAPGTTDWAYGASAGFSASTPGRFDNPFFTGGLKLGLWFDKTGITGGYNWPDWAKYFGFYVDLSYHNLNYRKQHVTGRFNSAYGYAEYGNNTFGPVEFPTEVTYIFTDVGSASASGDAGVFSSRGRMFTLAFMFAARLGFYPDSEIAPFGRLQPYVAVGPALFVSSQSPSFDSGWFGTGTYTTTETSIVNTITTFNQTNTGTVGAGAGRARINGNTKSSVDIGLAVDAGFRYYMLKNVSLDVFFKYRWVKPSYSQSATFEYADFYTYQSTTANYSMKPTYHLFSGNVGVAYHF